jgi:hypothetical protein
MVENSVPLALCQIALMAIYPDVCSVHKLKCICASDLTIYMQPMY